MKTKFAATALILASGLIASTGFAADSGALSREQVRATVLQARADGSLASASAEIGNAVNAVNATPSSQTRERIMAEYFAAQKAGTLPQVGEIDALAEQPKFVSTHTRSEVRGEAVVAARLHTQDFGG